MFCKQPWAGDFSLGYCKAVLLSKTRGKCFVDSESSEERMAKFTVMESEWPLCIESYVIWLKVCTKSGKCLGEYWNNILCVCVCVCVCLLSDSHPFSFLLELERTHHWLNRCCSYTRHTCTHAHAHAHAHTHTHAHAFKPARTSLHETQTHWPKLISVRSTKMRDFQHMF